MADREIEKQVPQAVSSQEAVAPAHIPIQGRFDKYRSSYWGAAIAALGLRYASAPFIRELWNVPADKANHWIRHAYGPIAGAFMYGVTALFARNTYRDMRNIFAEAVGAELGKKPEDVGIRDIWASQNSVVIQTRHNFIKYNLRRFGVNTVFFAPWIPGVRKLFKPNQIGGIIPTEGFHPESGAHFGVAANMGYLLSDIFSRKATFFETLQMIIDQKINHTDKFDESITGSDLLNLYERNQQVDKDPGNSFMKLRGTANWDKATGFFDRMAELMNQTYKNKTAIERAAFGFPQFIYLIGHDLVHPDRMEQSAAYMEIANQYGLQAVKTIAQNVHGGIGFAQAAAAYPVAAKDCGCEAEKAPEGALPGKLAAREAMRRAQPGVESPAL